MRFAILGLFVLTDARISRRASTDTYHPSTTRSTTVVKPTPPPKTTYYDPCKEMCYDNEEKCKKNKYQLLERCREETFCRHDKNHRECCTIDYHVYMDWYAGDWKEFRCPDDRLTNTKKEKYCNEDSSGVYCCAKKDVFQNKDDFSCEDMKNVDDDKIPDFDKPQHLECKCNVMMMARAYDEKWKPLDPCRCKEGMETGEVDWDMIFETEGSFYTTEGSSEKTWVETDGPYWDTEGSYWDTEGSYWENDGSFWDEDQYDKADWDKDSYNETFWTDLYNITIVGWSDESDETKIDFFNWTVGGEDMVWIEPSPQPGNTTHCLADIDGKRCCNKNETMIAEWIQQGSQFVCRKREKPSFYDPCKDKCNEDKDNFCLESCLSETSCRHDMNHRECCTTNYDEYMQWFMGDWKEFRCPADKITTTKNEKYCSEDMNGVRCCAKRDVFKHNENFNCHDMNNVDNDKFSTMTDFDEHPYLECKCKDTALARALDTKRNPCRCDEGAEIGEVDWDVIFETEGSFYTTEGSSEKWVDTDGSYWEDDGSYWDDDNYDEADIDAWADLFNIEIVGWSDGSDETYVDFFDWTVDGEDMVWIEPIDYEVEDESFCLDDINGERCCNDNDAIIEDWINQGTEFECPSDWDKLMEDLSNALGENLMVVLGIVAAIVGTCCICLCCCCCGCRKRQQQSQQQSVTVNVNKK